MSLIFYYAPMSSAATVHWALEELGVPYEKVKVDIHTGEQSKPEFLKINPNGKVPAIVHDGVAVFESAAIIIHLGETFGVDKKLFPPPGGQRAEALKWLVWTNVSLGEALARFQRNTVARIPEEQRNAKAGEIGKKDVESHLRILDAALAGKTYLVGDAFSLVDVHLAGWIAYLGMCGFDRKAYANIDAWATRCCARPAFGKVMSG
jgi:glutathione S-transferase